MGSLVGCATTGVDITYDIPLQLQPDVAESVRPHTMGAVAEFPRVEITTEIKNVGNFGKSVYSEAITRMQRDPETGLLRAESQISHVGATGGESTASVVVMSICGLVPLLLESGASSTENLGSGFTAGGSSYTIRFPMNSQSASRRRLVEFSTESENICAPVVGKEFALSVKSELQLKFNNGVAASNRLHQTSETISCSLDDSVRSAAEIGTHFGGDYIRATCVTSALEGDARRSEHAFLFQYGIYLPIFAEISKYETHRYTYAAPST